MTARRMTKTDRRRKARRANATTYFQSNSDGMRLYYRWRRPDAFIRWLRKREFTTIDQLIAEHEKDPRMKALLDVARADLKQRIAKAGGLKHVIEVEPFALPEECSSFCHPDEAHCVITEDGKCDAGNPQRGAR